ncbi:MarR family transcriptional regulator [Sphingomonas sp. CGMCC 1.13654]|uniref:MarR family transcriptional regulator n=1 Tax=Sphingomonas chungangi TaxID=2683589 RepID=A0A838L536_9SPHN|nr:MarR family transcriptional regulator [Sphingomonas chungangi]MBA2933569.1 MarR family transcriptional regulator [Sphingomonas chungangi]
MAVRSKKPSKSATGVAGPHKYQATHAALDPLFDGEIDYLVRTIRIREVRAIEIMLSPFGLNLSAWYPLAVLRAADGMSQRELGIRLDLKDAAIGKAIDAMETASLLRRKTDKTDRRKTLVFLTPRGKDLAEKVAERRQQFLGALVDGFSKAEVKQFTDFLKRCYSNIDRFVEIETGAAAQSGGDGA